MESTNHCRHLSRLALFATAFIWGTSFVVLKNTLDTVPTLYTLTIRFGGAALIMFLAGIKDFKKLDKSYWKGGALMGVALITAYITQTYGLVYTTPGKNAFLTATYCVIVPFLYWIIYKKRPDKYNISAALLCIVGMGFVSLQNNFSIGLGEGLTIICGFFYAAHIIIIDKYIPGRNVVLLTMVQFIVAAAISGAGALMLEEFPHEIPGDVIAALLYLSFVCTAACFFFQIFGQKHTPPSTAAIILTLESVFGTILSVIFYKEALTLRLMIGFTLIFISVILAETKLSFLQKSKIEKTHL